MFSCKQYYKYSYKLDISKLTAQRRTRKTISNFQRSILSNIFVFKHSKNIVKQEQNNKYDRNIKWHKLNNVGFIQSGKTLRKIGNFEGNNLKPDIVFVNEEELILIEVAICFEDLVKNRINQKSEKYEKNICRINQNIQPN